MQSTLLTNSKLRKVELIDILIYARDSMQSPSFYLLKSDFSWKFSISESCRQNKNKKHPTNPSKSYCCYYWGAICKKNKMLTLTMFLQAHISYPAFSHCILMKLTKVFLNQKVSLCYITRHFKFQILNILSHIRYLHTGKKYF